MQEVRRNIIVGHALLLGAGALIGWLYDHTTWGLLAAALVGLGWHIRQLLAFDQALRDKDFGRLRHSDSIWSQFYSRFSYLRSQSKEHKKNYRRLVKEVRKSTNAMPDGGIILNAAFEIVLCNKAAQQLAGFRRRKDKGQRVDNILRDPAFGAYLKSGDFAQGVEIRSPVREGSWLLCRIVPYGSEQLLLLIQDVTKRRRLAVMRRDFVANASHELRSPLTVLSGYLDLLADDDDVPARWQRPLGQMQAQASRMNHIVAELLELSRLESEDTAPVDECVDICSLLNNSRNTLAEGDNIPDVTIQCDADIRVLGSAAEIESLIMNLLSNAIRHTAADGVIEMSWVGKEDGATLTISDTGEGIEPEHLPRLTERFYRVDAGRSRDGGGVGLGLAIVKHVLNRHQADLQVDSVPRHGSTFSCRFPPGRLVRYSSVVTGDRG